MSLPIAAPPATLKKLARLGLVRRFDLVLHLPLRYEDETRLTPVRAARYGEPVMVEGEITAQQVQYKPRKQLVATLADESGQLILRFLHFYPTHLKQLAVGQRVRAMGEVRHGYFGDEMVHPKIRDVTPDTPLADHLTPVYPAVQGVTQPMLRRLIAGALRDERLDDTLPEPMRHELGLVPFADAVRILHQPPARMPVAVLADGALPAWQRLKFDELLAQQLSMRLAYRARRAFAAPVLKGNGQLTRALLQALPFELTRAQARVMGEISHDLAQSHPMHRLLQGDVGSGKTVVAALAALIAIEAGWQAALMAPTEILAEQHHRKLAGWLAPLGIKVVWLSGSLKKKDKQAAIEAMASGEAQLAIGTHALFQDGVSFARLGLVLIDEQHRFGVSQRLALTQKGGEPHQLTMSATPIPRTLAMSYFADLDVSVIDELPPGRTPIQTKLISTSRRHDVMAAIRKEIDAGRQAYWVCPLIEESETLELQNAVATFEELAESLPGIVVGLVHGRLKPDEKAAVMAAFQQNVVQLLVATTVIEVGVDVPNATLMVIEHAERMGLAQLHQLRGRVGRGEHASRCVLLFEEPLSEIAKARLKVIYQHTDGFEIARQDLHIRGPGEFLGARQSGAPLLRFADPERDAELLESAKHWAPVLLEQHPDVVERHLARWLSGREQFLRA
ncbi:ATP-dependent DNA helicase RecG [Laribacter hongkongensis]|uniref:ATP-dependent DNA helicase RecG n=1 Tax=Laribacter hongkongensis TaxID=168471 RepID=UPI001EFD3EC8|nr:ATP-dependent DNA helicase RecG [Laribacter hongkongensis]MCG9040740.1 ATP-dependent DNA helicase RecG [Laribacter hongkongensis]MCG9067896.1 ATP-dependent DNA helicase RecG [Laribacter hongkongensis]